MRSCLAPFRNLPKRNWGKGSLVWQYGPVDLEALWARIQAAVEAMWESIGEGKSQLKLQRIRTLYQTTVALRNKHFQFWERRHMTMHDKNKHRPDKLRERSGRKPPSIASKLTLIRRVLCRWGNAMKRQEQMAEKARRKLLQQRKRERLERQRLEKLKKKRAREEQKSERLRREALRRQMKDPNLTMDDLLGHLDATNRCWIFPWSWQDKTLQVTCTHVFELFRRYCNGIRWNNVLNPLSPAVVMTQTLWPPLLPVVKFLQM